MVFTINVTFYVYILFHKPVKAPQNPKLVQVQYENSISKNMKTQSLFEVGAFIEFERNSPAKLTFSVFNKAFELFLLFIVVVVYCGKLLCKPIIGDY